MERLINRRQQGDLGEASAIEWFTRAGAVVSTPLGHSPDYDLIADFGEQPLRVQAKTSTQVTVELRTVTSDFSVHARDERRQSELEPTSTKLDRPESSTAFVLLRATGRRWLIPSRRDRNAAAPDPARTGQGIAEFEISPSEQIDSLVYGLGKHTP